MSARCELISIQQDLVSQLKEEIYGTLTEFTPELEARYEDYRQEFKRPFSISSPESLWKAVDGSNLIFIGDYHTLPQAQETIIKIAEIAGRERNIVLALEMFDQAHQEVVDQYLSGELDEEGLLEGTEYFHTWGFDWRHYRTIVQLAKRKGIPILAIDERRSQLGLDERDQNVARTLAQAMEKCPDDVFVVFMGDLHLARGHLPGLTLKELADRGLNRRFNSRRAMRSRYIL